MKLGMYIMTPEPISMTYFINPSHQSVSVCVSLLSLLVSKQGEQAKQSMQRTAMSALSYRSVLFPGGNVCSPLLYPIELIKRVLFVDIVIIKHPLLIVFLIMPLAHLLISVYMYTINLSK
jgi:hypothetical protein